MRIIWRAKFSPILWYSISLIGFSSSTASAQIVPDNTLGNESSTVNQDVTSGDRLVDLIEGGATRGNNLFHSFAEFNVEDGSAVYFANPDGIANILTRVTGNNPSEIFGTLGVDGAANLFLLNPNGIVFGENAQLDLNGSFLATTADSYIFNNGFAYSASNPEAPPLLTVNIPVGLQFGNKAEAIKALGTGNNLSLDEETFELVREERPAGLEVDPGKTLALMGGDINLTGGNLTAPQGRIELGSVTDVGKVAIMTIGDGFSFDYGEIDQFGDINLTDAGSIDTSGNKSGNIRLQSQNLFINKSSAIVNNTIGSENGGKTQIKTTKSIEISDNNDEGFVSAIFNQVEIGATGKGADLNIETGSLSIIDGGVIAATKYGDGGGDGGNINIIASEFVKLKSYTSFISTEIYGGAGQGGHINVTTPNLSLDESLILSTTIDVGNAGDIDLKVGSLSLTDTAQIYSGTRGEGNAGDINLKATDIELIGGNEDFASGIYSAAQAGSTGNAGNINLKVNRLRIIDGGEIFTGTRGEGNAGDITLSGKSLELTGFSGIFALAKPGSIGKAGDITLEGFENLSITNGAEISSSTSGNGNAGNLEIQSQQLQITGTTLDGKYPSAIAALSNTDAAAGSIKINSDNVAVTKGGEISVSNFGNGSAGNLNISTQELSLDNSGKLKAEVAAGNQGNINLRTDNIFLRNGSEINAKATGTATGGNIDISNTDNIVLLKTSKIIADADEGNGGNVDITTQGLFVSTNSLISASSELGLDGNVKLESINGDRPLELDQLPENLVNRTQRIVKTCGGGKNQFAIAGRGGLPENPLQNLRGQTIWQDLRLTAINPSSIKSKTSQVTEYQFSTSVLEAQGWKINNLGRIELIAINANARPLDNQGSCQ